MSIAKVSEIGVMASFAVFSESSRAPAMIVVSSCFMKEERHIPRFHVSQPEFSVQIDGIVLCVLSPVNSLTAKGKRRRRFRVVRCSFPDLLKHRFTNTVKTHW